MKTAQPTKGMWPAISIAEAHAQITAPGMPCEMEQLVIQGVPTRVWKNAPKSLRAVVERTQLFGEKVLLVHGDDRVSFDGFFRAVSAMAHELAGQGVKKGDRVAILMQNLPEWPIVFYAAASIGAIVTPLNIWWTVPELEYGLTDSGACVVIADTERLERVSKAGEHCSTLQRTYVARARNKHAGSPAVISLHDIIGEPNTWKDLPNRALPDCELSPEDPATIFYTSGTTGTPKGALGTHRNVNSDLIATLCVAQRASLRRGETPPVSGTADTLQRANLLSVPLYHAIGCLVVLNPSVYGGIKLLMMRGWDPVRAFELIEREKITAAGGVPTLAWQLIEHPQRKNYDLSSLESLAYGGAPAAPELVRRLKQALPGVTPGNAWGMTETSGAGAIHTAEDYESRPDSCGPALPVTDIKIMSLQGDRELPIGEVGELWCRGPQVVRSYWNKPEATAETFENGWVKTGDLARLDGEGFCFIVDRTKDMLIRGGKNIYCIEVENALHDHHAVMDAALIGIPHRVLGEKPGAVVALKPGAEASEQELCAFVAKKLAAFKVPVKIIFWSGPLPRNANGKIIKSDLKKLFVTNDAM
jgi:long-chain acyl-CoA synthetase